MDNEPKKIESQNPKEMMKQNVQNLDDRKNIQERMASSQARNLIQHPIINDVENNTAEEEIQENPNELESQNKDETEGKAKKQGRGLRKIATSSFGGGTGSGQLPEELYESIMAPLKRLLIFAAAAFIILMLVILFAASTLITYSSKDREYNKSTIKKFSSITNDDDGNKILDQTLFKFVPYFDSSSDDPEDFFEENLKEDLILYLQANGYCHRNSCKKTDAYAFYKKLIIHVLEHEKNKESIDVGLLYETMSYYRADDELFSGSASSSDRDLKWWEMVLGLFKKKTDEMDKLTEKMFNNKKIDLNQYAAYLLYGEPDGNDFDGYIDIGDADSMAEAMIATGATMMNPSKLKRTGENNNAITHWFGPIEGYSYYWCAAFVSWVVAHTEFEGKKLYDVIPFKSASVAEWISYFQNSKTSKFYYNDYCNPGRNKSKYTPKIGDIIMYGWGSHIGIVAKVNGTSITALEGNTGANENDVVKYVQRDMKNCYVSGYGSWY